MYSFWPLNSLRHFIYTCTSISFLESGLVSSCNSPVHPPIPCTIVKHSSPKQENSKTPNSCGKVKHSWSFVLHSTKSSSSKSSINSSRSWSAPGVTCESHSSATHLVVPWVPVPFGCEPDRMSLSLSSLSVPQSFSSRVSGAPLEIKILL